MENMRQIFTDTVIEILKTKSLSNITVTDIVSQYGMSRQFFIIILMVSMT